jgi:hypothetical protein
MALNENQASAGKPAAPVIGQSAPSWLLFLYLGGLVLVYIGERVLSGLEKGSGLVSFVGVLAVFGATLLRFSPRFRAGGERRSIETQLAVLSTIGVLALALYFVTSDYGSELLGIQKMEDPGRTRLLEFLTVSWVALITISTLPMIFVETALRPMRSSERPEARRVRSAATAGLTLGLAAVYGSLFVYAASGVDLDVDFSYFKTSRPSESTRKIAQSLTEPVRVVAFFPQVNEVREEVERYLGDLKTASPKLKVEVMDRLLAPKLARELKATQDGVIVLSKGTTTNVLTIGTELEQAKTKLKTLDRDFQEQLLKSARSQKIAYLTVGHGEINDGPRVATSDAARTGNIARTLLQRQNYLVKDLGLAQGLAREVPSDADLVLVLGPTEPFSAEELDSLKRYADGDGKLVLALDPDAFSTRDLVPGGPVEGSAAPGSSVGPASSAAPAASAPAAPAAPAGSAAQPAPANAGSDEASSPLAKLAEVVGVKFSPNVLANERNHVRLRGDNSDRSRLVSNSFSSHASVSTLSRNSPRAAVVLFGAGSVEQAPGSKTRPDFAVRAMTGTFEDKNRNYEFDKSSETQKLFNVAAAVSRPAGGAEKDEKAEDDDDHAGHDHGDEGKDDAKDDKAKDAKDKKKDAKDKKDVREMRAFVLADADAFSDFVMGEVMGNQVLFVDAVRWLVGEESFSGPPNTEEDVRIQHTKQEDLVWFYASIFGAPGLVLAAGVFVSRRSRRGSQTQSKQGEGR